ncbi:MAG: heme o synthase [Aigarchaeota archaeon]|nr:heme o synthase [Candidatus Pelearchaeum maunauluense]
MRLREYVSLTKPKIAFLNILTAVTAFLLAGGGATERLLILILAGYFAVGGASAINHYIDRDIDATMQRTRNRPLPSGRLSPAVKAIIFGVVLSVSAVIIATLFLNLLTAFFIGLGILIYILVYTIWLKRRTPWNIVIGGSAGSCSPLAGWAAAADNITLLSILLAILVFLWTPGHFWGLALRAEQEYKRAGLPMLPTVAGRNTTAKLIAVSNFITVACWLAIAFLLKSSISYLIITAPLTLWIAVDSIRLIHRPDDNLAWRIFKISSPWLAVLMLGSLMHVVVGF